MAKGYSFIFHGLLDDPTAQKTGQDLAIPYVKTKERKLSYRFFPHFHPYVAELIKRLIEGSIHGLQAADTEYPEKADGTLDVLPFSTLVVINGDVSVYSPNEGKQISLKGMQASLPDDTWVKFDGVKEAKLPGTMVLTPKRGMQVEVGGAKETILFETEIKLRDETLVTLASGVSAKLPAGTSLTLKGCKPRPELHEDFFKAAYDPFALVEQPYPVKDLDFTSSGAYAVYNWELFYHVPLTIAIHLSKNQRFEEAMHWFHYIFDPTDDSDGPTPERFWKVKPFQYTDVKLIEEVLINLSTGADPQLRQDTIDSIGAWKDSPFQPHVVARYRHPASMFKAVMAYLDNLIAWGDTLFRQDTGESINEATQLYILATNILGRRPQEAPKKGAVRPQTYADLRSDLDEFGNALRKLETEIPFDSAPLPHKADPYDQSSPVRSIGKTLYFCVPRNDKLLSYWDTVADRLFKIRNSLNIQGIFRQLPLFEPPIDPALLAKAAAAGLDIGAVINGVNQPLPLVRFQFLVQKATELAQEVKSLGGNLLSAIEKEDNEALAMLRAKHERVMLELAETVKYAQWQEAIKTREGLELSLANAIQRYTYYERLLGEKETDIATIIPELDMLEIDGLRKMKFKMDEPEISNLRDIEVDIVQYTEDITGGKKISSYELKELDLLKNAQRLQDSAVMYDLLSSQMALIPEFGAQAQPMGAGAAIKFGGLFLSKMFSMMGTADRALANRLTYEASKTAKIGSYARREQEWAFQSILAAGEINPIFKQLRAAQIREAITEWEWQNHQRQINNAEEIEQFLKGEKVTVGDKRHRKTGTQSFYTWMRREMKGLYGQCFQFAFDIAKKAERALQHELGDPKLSYLQFGYLAGKEGLLAGEKLYLDIKRMEMAYHDLNQREYELTKNVSLLQVDPLALLQLRTTGRCTVTLPEALFDMDGPGHYFRRIKSVAVSIPCVTGPYTSVNCTLTLLKSSIRKSPLLRDGSYVREDAEDDRFGDHFGSLQSIVTSTSQNDSGLFETNLHDERYLPFEGSGVVSEWQLVLPANPSEGDPRQFDYDTISDVILHLRYTAREGGALLQKGALDNLKNRISDAQAAGSVRLFSLRHEFPTEWAKFKAVKIESNGGTAALTLDLRNEHYPFWSRGSLESVNGVTIFAKPTKGTKQEITIADNSDQPRNEDSLVKDDSLGDFRVGKLKKIALPPPVGKFVLYFDDSSIEDLWLAIAWGKSG
jgi:hypothetical protein